MIRVFIDSSVLFAACYSNTGDAYALFLYHLLGKVELIASPFVIEEVQEHLAEQGIKKLNNLAAFLDDEFLNMVEPSDRQIQQAAEVIVDPDDAPIIAAAKKARVDALVTFDKKHMLKAGRREPIEEHIGAPVVTPSAILEKLRQ